MNIEEKVNRHNESFQRTRAIVFCARCGSTRIDQNDEATLKCYDCENTLAWDANKFSIRRGPAATDDVRTAFLRLEPGGRGYHAPNGAHR